MKYPHLSGTHQGIEVLESRIAPAAVTLSFFDKDHNAVTVTSSKGTMADLVTAVGVAEGATAAEVLHFKISPAFKGADISVLAGATTSDAILTRVATIDATGVDLGKLMVDGELDAINAGDSLSGTAGVKSIEVQTWGNNVAPQLGNELFSDVVGAIPTLTVHGDFIGAHLLLHGSASDLSHSPATFNPTDLDGKIGTLFIGGSLVGTNWLDGGHIYTTGDIAKATIVGSITGFQTKVVAGSSVAAPGAAVAPGFNGRFFSRGNIGSLVIGTDAVAGNVIGGDGESSGQIVGVTGIGSVTVKGKVQGGIGKESGSIGAVGAIGMAVITGDLIGGGGDRSGSLLGFTTINTVKIGGKIQGGKGFNSGAIGAGSQFSSIPGLVQIGNVTVGGDIIGGDGPLSGQIVSQGTIKNVTVNGSLIGGSQFETGAIGSLKGLGTILIKGDIRAGTGTRSGFIATEEEPIGRVGGSEIPLPSDANAPISSVTVLGSIIGTLDSDSSAGYRAGGILSSGALGPVVVMGDVIGGDNFQTGRIASSHALASVTIGGALIGGSADDSGEVFAKTTLGPVAIGDSTFTGAPSVGSPFAGRGIVGGSAFHSGAVIAGTLPKIDVFGDLQGGSGEESGVIETAGKMGAVYVRGNVIGGSSVDATRSGSIISAGAITSVLIGTNTNDSIGSSNLVGGRGTESGNIISTLDIGTVYIEGSIVGSVGESSGRIFSGGSLGNVYVGSQVDGGEGGNSGSIESTDDMGSVAIGVGGTAADIHKSRSAAGHAISLIARDLVGGLGDHSGAVISGGSLAKIDIYGYLLAGDGPYSGRVETQGEGTLGNMGPVFIAKSLIGTSGPTTAVHSGEIFSSGKLASVVIGDPKDTNTENVGNFDGGNALGSGTIASELDMGPVKIKASIVGGSGDESGKIISGRNLASLTVGASILGGTGNYDTTVESGDQLGQVFASGAIGPVIVNGNVQGNQSTLDSSGPQGSHSGEIRGASIKSVTIGGSILGGIGQSSGGLFSTSTDIGAVTIGRDLLAGSGARSGFISGSQNIASVKISGTFSTNETESTGTGAGYIAAGNTLGPVEARTAAGDTASFRPRISALNKITSVTIGDSIAYADILAGYSVTGQETNHAAQIGSVVIGTGTGPGTMDATNILAGFRLSSLFSPIPGLGVSKIASVVVKGAVDSRFDITGSFLVAANHLVSFTQAGTPLALTAGPGNDVFTRLPSTATYYGEISD